MYLHSTASLRHPLGVRSFSMLNAQRMELLWVLSVAESWLVFVHSLHPCLVVHRETLIWLESSVSAVSQYKLWTL